MKERMTHFISYTQTKWMTHVSYILYQKTYCFPGTSDLCSHDAFRNASRRDLFWSDCCVWGMGNICTCKYVCWYCMYVSVCALHKCNVRSMQQESDNTQLSQFQLVEWSTKLLFFFVNLRLHTFSFVLHSFWSYFSYIRWIEFWLILCTQVFLAI